MRVSINQKTPTHLQSQHNGSQIQRDHPEKFDQIIRALASGEPVRSIASRLGVDKTTVSGIRQHHPELLATARDRLSKSFMEVATIASEEALHRALNDPDKMSYRDLVLGAAIATDKALLLSGQATERVEVMVRHDEDEFDRILRQAKRAKVIEVSDTNIESPPPDQSAAPITAAPIDTAQDDAS